MTVTYKEYTEDKRNFFEKHDYDFTCDTSNMDEYGRYCKTYSFADGAQWIEDMCPTTEVVETEVCKAKVKITVKMFRTEYYSTESGSKYYYEKF